MSTPTTTWTRISRRLGYDRNPLRRRSDRIQAWLLPGAVGVFLILGPLLAIGAIWWAHSENTASRQAERSWHSAPAVLLASAPGPQMTDNGANSWLVRVPARWTVAGQQHEGRIPVVSGSRAGSTARVWLDSAGRVQTPPLTTGQARDRVVVSTSAALAALAALLTVLAVGCCRMLIRSRLISWEIDWLTFGPRWTHLQ
jgi:hypothetical protein